MTRRKRGFTLAEVIVMSLIFSIFSLTAVAGLTLSLRYWRDANKRMLAEQNARVAMQLMVAELRQSVVNPVTTIGYKTISPAVAATGILTPNANSTSATSLVFTEPSTTYDITTSGFSDNAANNYQRVNYYVSSNQLHRQVITYTSGGNVNTSTDTVIVSASSGGQLLLNVTWESSTTVNLKVTAIEGTDTFILNADVSAIGN